MQFTFPPNTHNNPAVPIRETPEPHAPANIIGLPLLARMKLVVEEGPQGGETAHFNNLPLVPV
jgi:hypothetical protein